jgi:hypothetical protein
MTRYILCILLVMSMANVVAWAEPDDYIYDRIARISYMEGYVSFQHTSDVDWTAASINLPLQPGDRIYTGPGGRAEIEFDEGSVLQLAEQTDIQFLSLNDEIIQIRILTGLSSLTVLSEANFEADTPAAAFIVLSKGVYRFDTKDNGDTDAIVRKGALDAVSHRFVHRIDSGEQMFITAEENNSYHLSRYDRRDAWDEWTDRRNADAIARTSRKYLPDNVYVGVSDLDHYGRWVTVESYGAAWVPFSVGVSWSPYSVGRWCYRPVWGWTWVSYEPWGWLPYHYGRWYRSASYGWCWLPGPSFSFNFWSPGLVTFYYGPTWVSWCPLGPGDYYSITNYYYNRRLYQNQVVNLRALHRRDPGDSINRHARGAFRTVDIAQFRDGGSRAIATRSGYRKITQPWNQGSLVRERLAVQPTSRSFSADPDRRAVRSRVVKPKPALVHAEPTALSAKRDGYIRLTNVNVTSRAVNRTKSGNTSKSGDTVNIANPNRERAIQNSQSTGGSSVRKQSNVGAVNRNKQESRSSGSRDVREGVGDTRNNSNSIKNGQDRNTVRSSPQVTSSRSNERISTVRSTTSRNSVGTVTSENSTRQRITRDTFPSITSGSRITSTPQNYRPSEQESVRINRSSGQSSSSRNSSSSSQSRSYSSSPSISRTPSYSTPSSDSRLRSTPQNSRSSAQGSVRINRSSAQPRNSSSSSRSNSYSTSSSSRKSSSTSSSSSGKSSSSNRATRRSK